MAKQYCYGIIDRSGKTIGIEALRKDTSLREKLTNGWRPVRESPMSSGGEQGKAYSLVMLEKD
jgi:hypothetical protein